VARTATGDTIARIAARRRTFFEKVKSVLQLQHLSCAAVFPAALEDGPMPLDTAMPVTPDDSVRHNAAGALRVARFLAIFGVLLPLLAAFGLASPARAEFHVCNQTLDVVNVAIGQQENEAFRTEGWWTVGSNQCATVIRGDLQVRYLYVYASDVFGQPILNGTQSMCVGASRFTIEGITDCWVHGYRAAQFVEVDTKATSDWTLFLSGAPGD
jgi:uncharacterized membrane protein